MFANQSISCSFAEKLDASVSGSFEKSSLAFQANITLAGFASFGTDSVAACVVWVGDFVNENSFFSPQKLG